MAYFFLNIDKRGPSLEFVLVTEACEMSPGFGERMLPFGVFDKPATLLGFENYAIGPIYAFALSKEVRVLHRALLVDRFN
ncbi:MAG: hypothetical protein ACR652_11315 [Methylocystis sp.]|uniref:hypothetical protein n=1 Tax=Methylocystis sp. TaxID=1911079 RepID=UPI003DA62B92